MAALDGIIVIVSKANPLTALTIAQIKDIFLVKTTDWGQVGGPAGPIHLVGRDSKPGTAETFKALVMGGTPVSTALTVVDGAEGVALKVQGDPNATGYTGFAYLGGNKALSIGTECGLEYPPSDLYVRADEYPLSRRLFLYTPANATNVESQPFVDFALGTPGQDIAQTKNFINLVPRVTPTSFGRNAITLDLVGLAEDRGASRDDLAALVTYAKFAVRGQRLTTTFRFQSGSSALDARAVRDIDRLADFLKSPTAAGRSLMVAGFADSVGSASAGRRLGLERARQIARLLQDKGIEAKSVVGYGRIAPVACKFHTRGTREEPAGRGVAVLRGVAVSKSAWRVARGRLKACAGA